MTLMEYYKQHAYDQGYADAKNGDYHEGEDGKYSVYWQDEMDFYIVQGYLSSYTSSSTAEDMEKELGEQDMALIKALGFTLADFEDEDYKD